MSARNSALSLPARSLSRSMARSIRCAQATPRFFHPRWRMAITTKASRSPASCGSTHRRAFRPRAHQITMSGQTQYEFPPCIAALPISGSDTLFPVRRIYCVGRNYVDHIREMKEADEREPPFFFQKPSDAIVQDGATVPYPPDTTDFQFEVELVAAIARGGQNIATASVHEHIFGYAVGIELTRRDRQR